MTSSGVPVGDTTLLQRLKELDEKATPKPWRVELYQPDPRDDLQPVVVMADHPDGDYWTVDSTLLSEEDAALIASLRNALPAVVTLIETAKQVVADIEAVPEYRLNPQTEEEIAAALAPFVGEAT